MKRIVSAFVTVLGAFAPSISWAGQEPAAGSVGAPPAQVQTCDQKMSAAKAGWRDDAHGGLANTFHSEHMDLAGTWCRVWEAQGNERRYKAGDFARVLFTGDGVHPSVASSLVPGTGFAAGASVQIGQHLTQLRLAEKAQALFATDGSRAFSGRLDMLGSDSRRDNHHNNGTVLVAHQRLMSITDYGEGNDSHLTDESSFALRRTAFGATLETPITPMLFLTGEASALRLQSDAFTGPIFLLTPGAFAATTALSPLQTSSTYAVFGGGIRLNYPADEVTTGYATEVGARFREFHETRVAEASFGRADLAWTNRFTPNTTVGTFSASALGTLSFVPSGHATPLALQPTLGGTDIGGLQMLRSFSDYRFRGDNRIGLTIEHEREWLGPLASLVFADWGGVATRLSDVDFKRFHHSFGAGVSIRVGGFTVFRAFYAFGGGEGTRTTFTGASDAFAETMNTRTLF